MEVLARKITYEEFAKMEFPDDDPSYHSIEIYSLQGGAYHLHAFGISGEQVSSLAIKDLSIEVDAIFLKKPEA